MTLIVAIPGRAALELEHLLLDVNGTLTNRGALLGEVEDKLAALREEIAIQLVSADTFGTLDQIAERLGVPAISAHTGADKLRLLDELGRHRCAVIGNGANDVLVLGAAALGFAVIGPEGASPAAIRAADVVCASAADALDLLLEPRALAATLRA